MMSRNQSYMGELEGNIDSDLSEIARNLPAPEGTKYPYDILSINGLTVYLAGQIPKQKGELAYVGKVGNEISIENAKDAAKICSQQALAWLNRSAGGVENINRILRLTCYVAHDDTFEDLSEVANGASQYLIETLADKGRHVRAVVGVKSLPRNSPVLIEYTVALNEPV